MTGDKPSSELTWSFDLDTVEGVFEAYKQTDFWSLLESSSSADVGNLHFVRAGRNPAWTPEVLAQFEQLGDGVKMHTLEGVGHWVHIEAADRVLDMLSGALTEAEQE